MSRHDNELTVTAGSGGRGVELILNGADVARLVTACQIELTVGEPITATMRVQPYALRARLVDVAVELDLGADVLALLLAAGWRPPGDEPRATP